MSGAQGAQPPSSFTATTYESVPEQMQENRPRTDLRSKEDDKGIKIDKIQDKVQDAAGLGGPVFGPGKDQPPNKQDLGVTGTG
ncbi:hypothetical protein BVRB_1g021930 [Beta vulgaris subsp. vulgaris]|uniref:uncharacterized protein LOC104905767 n=1 Tax=Beta vulgaris subsp. vulgaris TaxID=3555 RepID=UPI00053F3585|nr:uncharacterized protein LOC104905767 [Beta vulgaris subsp. vulgaris]KMS99623.1 hypothetical protein BVRB_1g021930 [Beta vulgaris subsp. vulgaris]